MAMVRANKILTLFMLLLDCVKESSDSEMMRGMGLWEIFLCSQRTDVKCSICPNMIMTVSTDVQSKFVPN